jgi:hypothetical protein
VDTRAYPKKNRKFAGRDRHDSCVSERMAKQLLGALAGVLFVAVGCGGHAATLGAAGAPASDPSPGASGATSGASGAPGQTNVDGGNAGDPGASPCQAELADVTDALGVKCPAELCAGTVLASACDTLPQGITHTSEASCDGDARMRVLTFALSPTRRKACYYVGATDSAPALLVGATAWSDTPDFCDGSAAQVDAGQKPVGCMYYNENTLCDLTGAEPSAPQAGPPRACYNNLGADCTPCCDAKPPSCVGKPQNYPGFDCTPPATDDNGSYCYCSCDTEQWTCAC